jgi:nuclear transport factor 2 (NTF2) superfamily protein
MESSIEVFFSYAHEDEPWRDELDKHLSLLKRQHLIASWHDRNILPGLNWKQEIDSHLRSAQIILLLISSNFLASEYCWGVELQEAMRRHQTGEALVIPIIVRPVDWHDAPFGTLQALPRENRAITSWPNPDEALLQVTEGIRKAVTQWQTQHPAVLSSSSPLRSIPYGQNPFFTGREDILTCLYTAFRAGKTNNPTQPQAISGLGGIGKTQIAVEYAYRYQDDYETIVWLKAESPETLILDLLTVAHLLNLPETEEQEHLVEAVKRWFQVHTSWLLIFDNADDLLMVRDFLPTGGKGHILLTTRAHATGRIAQRIELEKMGREEGALFLLHRATILDPDQPLEAASSTDQDTAKEIVQAMDGLPLALDQSGAFLEETQVSLSAYMHLFHTRQADLLKRRGELVREHPDPVTTTWSLSFEKIQHANPAATDLLRLCAFLDPDTIQEEIITKGAAELGPILQPIATDPLKLNEAIGALLAYSLIHRTPHHTLTIHRLVQAILKHGMNKNTKRRWAERAIRIVNYAFPKVEYENWLRCQAYIPHVLASKALIEEQDLAFTEAAQLLNGAGNYLTKSAQYEQAEPLLQRSLAIYEQILGPDHPSTTTIRENYTALLQEIKDKQE